MMKVKWSAIVKLIEKHWIACVNNENQQRYSRLGWGWEEGFYNLKKWTS
jgi:hypothetical protein